jgi:hypothetical protein
MHQGTHTDPRPDIKHDHHLWKRILICCQGQPNIQGKLHYIRCLGGYVIETPTMYRLLQCDIADIEWADVKTRILEQIFPQIIKMFPMWRQKEITDEVLNFAVGADMTLEEAEDTIRNCPFREHEQIVLHMTVGSC